MKKFTLKMLLLFIAITFTSASFAQTFTTTVLNDGVDIYIGSSNEQVLKLVIANDTVEKTLNKLVVKDNDGIASYSNMKMWYSTTDDFSTAVQYGNTVTEVETYDIANNFTSDLTLEANTTYYFWLTVDVASDVAPSDPAEIVNCRIARYKIDDSASNFTDQPEANRPIVEDTSDMVFVSCTATNSNTNNVEAESTDQELLRIKIDMSGTQNPLSVSSIIIRATGSTSIADISDVKIWYTGTSPVFDASTQFASTVTPTALDDDMVFTSNQELSTGSNYFWVTYSIASNATVGNVVDAILQSVTIGGNSVEITDPDPTGNRTIIAATHNMVFDSVNITNSNLNDVAPGDTDVEILKVEVVTSGYNNPIDLTAIKFNFGGSDNIEDITAAKVYYTGSSDVFATTNLFGEISDADWPSTPYQARTVSDTITLEEGSNYFWIAYDVSATAVHLDTLDARVKQIVIDGVDVLNNTIVDPVGERVIIDNSPMAFVSCTVVNSNTDGVELASTDQELLQIKIDMSGSQNPLSLSDIKVRATGSSDVADISDVKIWYTGTSSDFATSAQFGTTIVPTSLDEDMVFTSNQELSPGSNYFWVTYSIASNATVGNVVDAILQAVIIGGDSVTITDPDPSGNRQILGAPMTYVSTEVVQLDTTAVNAGDVNQQIMRINIKTTGSSNPIELDFLGISPSGTTNYDDITDIKIWSTGSSDVFTTTNLLVSEDYVDDYMDFDIYEDLLEGDNYFWVTYSVSASANNGNVLDAKLDYIETSDDIYEINENPQGHRRIVNSQLSSEADILTYSFNEQTGPANIDNTNHTINVEVSNGTDLTNLVATFTLSTGATAYVSSVQQESGVTANDFTNPVIYTVVAEDGTTTQDWTVTVNLSTGVKDLTKDNLVIYPNPNGGQFYLQFANTEDNINLDILNAQGKVVATYKDLQTNTVQSIALKDAANGTYFVRIISKDMTIVKKINIVK